MVKQASIKSATGRGRDYENYVLCKEWESAVFEIRTNVTLVAISIVTCVAGLVFATTIIDISPIGARIALMVTALTIPLVITCVSRHDKLKMRLGSATKELRT